MKRTITAIATLLTSVFAVSAQDEGLVSYMTDAMNWSSNDYYGSARTMGMGNAVTAVGGDIGSVSLNPAGSAVAGYSQVAVSPGLSLSIVSASGVPSYDGNTYMSNSTSKTSTKFTLPLNGVVFNFDLGNITGIKSWTFGFIVAGTNRYNRSVNASGLNEAGTSSFAGSLAAVATDEGFGNFNELTDLGWKRDVFGQNSSIPGGYAGITENGLKDGSASLGGAINQYYNLEVTGSKTDYIFNFGCNCSDVVYFGANIGITGLSYNHNYVLYEDAVDPDFFQTGFRSLSHSYSYRASGSGVYLKAGIIVTPVAGLRFGAAVQTPTRLNITEKYSHSLSNKYLSESLNGSTEPGSWRFNVVSPWRFNVGAAYTIGKAGLVSVDYELVDYTTMRFKEFYSGDLAFCNDINRVIQGTSGSGKCMGVSHLLRAGAEIKVTPEFAVRLGYNLTTSPECELSHGSRNTVGTKIQAGTLGIGYDSPGSFFCDLAAKLIFHPSGQIEVYESYTNRMTPGSPEYRIIGGPVVDYSARMLNLALTLGWRF